MLQALLAWGESSTQVVVVVGIEQGDVCYSKHHSPKLIVISDKEQAKGRKLLKRAPYQDHAYGVRLPDGSFCMVLTTRGDGRIRVKAKDSKWEDSHLD